MASLGVMETPFDIGMSVIDRFYLSNSAQEEGLVTTSLCLVPRPSMLRAIANRIFRNAAWQSQFDPAVSAERFRETLKNVTAGLDSGKKPDAYLLNQAERATEAFNNSNKKTIEELRSWGIPTPDEQEVVIKFDEERRRPKDEERQRWCWDALLGSMPGSPDGSELNAGNQDVIPATPPTTNTSSSPKTPSSHSSPGTEGSRGDEVNRAERNESFSPRESSPEKPLVVGSSPDQLLARGSEQEKGPHQPRNPVGQLRRMQSLPPLTMVLRDRSPKETAVLRNRPSAETPDDGK